MNHSVMAGYAPADVWKYFEEICAVPHGSGNTKQISDYLVSFAKAHDLEYYQDAWNNVVIIREATPGYEAAAPVILQGHMDMVCEQDPDSSKDMTTDGLDLIVDGDWLTADKTTLGGDDGIALAIAMAIMTDPTAKHPRLEAVFTVDEETGMTGALHIDLSMCRGRKLLNLDSEEEGVFTASCAGGTMIASTRDLSVESVSGFPCTLSISGLQGGHSGADIHLGRANAHMLLARLLFAMQEQFPIHLLSITGGTKDNVIPKTASADLLIEDTVPAETITVWLEAQQAILREEYRGLDDAITASLTCTGEVTSAKALTKEDLLLLLNAILNQPHGYLGQSGTVPGLTELSNNLGILRLTEGQVQMGVLLRSMHASGQFALRDRYLLFLKSLGFTCTIESEYSGWAFAPDSELRNDLVSCYEDLFGNAPVIYNMHAGVECGILSAKLPGLDCISIGPQLECIHTSSERLSISSTLRTWQLVTAFLARCR